MFQMLCCKSKNGEQSLTSFNISIIVKHLLLCRCSLPSANTSPFCSGFYRLPAVNALNYACPARLVARKLLIHQTLSKIEAEEWQSGQGHKKKLRGTSRFNMLLNRILLITYYYQGKWLDNRFWSPFYSIHWSPYCLLFCRYRYSKLNK